MGLNYHHYLREAYRLMRYGGWLKIAEPASRWRDDKLGQLLGALSSCGFSIVGEPDLRNEFIYLSAMKS